MSGAIDRMRLAEETLDLSRQMMAAAEAGNWEALQALSTRREQAIAALFADPQPDSRDNREWLALVGEVRELNEELLTLAMRERERVGQALMSFRSARKAQAAYSNTGNGG